ncbi:MAG: hypothetical protein QG623_412 [Patescibacteria group bacterium]|nr:hypothetical protein [Patescibacteria group bacterium]
MNKELVIKKGKPKLSDKLNSSIKTNTNEFLFVAYVFTFPLMGLLIPFFKQYSIFLLTFPALLILLVSFWSNAKHKMLKPDKFYLVAISLVSLVLLIDMVARRNAYTFRYAYQFIIFGIMPMYLLSKVRDLKQVLKYLAFFSVPVIVLYSPDPFIKYFVTGDYLKFGYFAMLPAYLGVHIGRKYLGFKWLLPFELVALFQIVFFSNRGALVTAMVFILLSKIFIDKRSLRKLLLIITMCITAVVFTFYLKPILETSIEYLQENNLESYSLNSLYQSVEEGGDPYSGRQEIWSNAESDVIVSPIVGHGTGYFISRYGVYTHNIYLELLSSWGIIGLSGFILFSVAYIYSMSKSKGTIRLFMLLMAVIGLIPLLFSLEIFSWLYFWLFFYSISLNRLSAYEQ